MDVVGQTDRGQVSGDAIKEAETRVRRGKEQRVMDEISEAVQGQSDSSCERLRSHMSGSCRHQRCKANKRTCLSCATRDTSQAGSM